jgi:hypothetical protein
MRKAYLVSRLSPCEDEARETRYISRDPSDEIRDTRNKRRFMVGR